jgi:hypothetical protein
MPCSYSSRHLLSLLCTSCYFVPLFAPHFFPLLHSPISSPCCQMPLPQCTLRSQILPTPTVHHQSRHVHCKYATLGHTSSHHHMVYMAIFICASTSFNSPLTRAHTHTHTHTHMCTQTHTFTRNTPSSQVPQPGQPAKPALSSQGTRSAALAAYYSACTAHCGCTEVCGKHSLIIYFG